MNMGLITKKNALILLALLASFAIVQVLRSANIITSYYEITIATACINVILATSLNLITGFTGQFSLGHAGFMSIGAYTCGIMLIENPTPAGFLAGLFLGGIIAAIVGILIGIPTLRLKGDYLAIATLGFSEIIRVLFTNFQTITNGAVGFKGIPPVVNLWWSLGIMALVIVFILRLMRTSYGRALKAIRDDEVAAESMGISLFKHKMYAFVLSGFIAGLGGGLIASIVGSINPLQFRFTLAYEILLIVVLGGMGSVSGTVVAAFVITAAKEWLRWLDNGFSLGLVKVPAISGLRMVVFSVLLMLVILFYRQGLSGGKEFSWQALIGFPGKLYGKVAGGVKRLLPSSDTKRKGGEKP